MKITHIVVQAGYCVFGVGSTRDGAIADAARWMESDDGVQGGMSNEDVEACIVVRPSVGEFTVLTEGHADFDSYLKNQGGFEQRADGWYEDQ